MQGEKLKKARLWLGLSFLTMFLWPGLLDELAFFMRLARGIAAYMVLQSWVKGGAISGRITSPLHKWLRSVSNGKTRETAKDFLDRLDFPDRG